MNLPKRPPRPDTLAFVQAKHCVCCRKLKPWADFRECKFTGRLRFVPVCRECDATRISRHREAHAKYVKNQNAKLSIPYGRLKHIKRMYNMSLLEYEALLSKNAGKCEICGSTERLHIDHLHGTKQVRGLLCQECNHGIGNFKDNVTLLTKACSYLDRFMEAKKAEASKPS